MRITYDADVDMAYIYLRNIGKGEVKRTLEFSGHGRRVVLDFDADRQLVGIEVFDAKKTLPMEAMSRAIVSGSKLP